MTPFIGCRAALSTSLFDTGAAHGHHGHCMETGLFGLPCNWSIKRWAMQMSLKVASIATSRSRVRRRQQPVSIIPFGRSILIGPTDDRCWRDRVG